MIFRRLCSTSAASVVSQIQADSRIISGIQPTSVPHVGNYLGFVENFVRLQNEHVAAQKFLFIADYHSISVKLPHIGQLDESVRKMAACLLACGIDPTKTTLFVQSQVSEHTEMGWILLSTQTIARMQRLTQFKDKSGSYTTANIPLGLINYPMLQVADVLLYKGTHIPVGEDQTQHFNLIGHVATKLNNLVREQLFPLPVMITSDYPRIKSLRNPAMKMSKSDPSPFSCVYILDSTEFVQEKFRRAFTDSLGTIVFDPVNRQGVSNLLQILAAFSNQSIEKTVEECQSLDTLALKERTADAVNAKLDPIKQKYEKFMEEPSFVVDILTEGSNKAREIAQETLHSLKECLGFYTGKQ